jgi:hypothetical protein
LNPYAYVGSNPVNAVDPMGLFTVGQMLDESALRAASMDNTIKLAALSFASATWNLFGAENISRWADGQSSSKIGLSFEAAAALPLVGPFSKLGKIATVSELTDRAVTVVKTADKFSRTPKSLMDQMVLDAAKQGNGVKIIDNLRDPKFKGMEKWSYTEKSANGLRSEVHYVRDPKTGKLLDFKFKHHADTGQ